MTRTETTCSPGVLELQDVAPSSPWETIRRGARMISPKVGIIRHLGHGLYHAQDPVTFALGVAATDLSRINGIVNSPKGGGGGEQLAGAVAATIGEAAERYCMLFYDKGEMVYAPWREVADDAPTPEMLRLYSREQVEREPPGSRMRFFDEDARVYWTWGTSLTSGKPRLVPAGLVYMGYSWDDDEAAVGRNASSGLAAGLTIEEAILTALYELVERDAFTIRWLNRMPGRRLEIDDPELREDLDTRFHASHPRVDIRLYDLTLDVPVPTAFMIMRRPAEFGPSLSLGASTRGTMREAVVKAMREAGQALPYYRFLLQQLGSWEPRDDFTDLTTFDHHCILYQRRPDLVPAAIRPWDEVEETVPLSAVPRASTGSVLGDIRALVEHLAAVGLEVIVCEVTTPDVAEVGLRVVRVVVPGLVPMHGNHNYPFLGVRRLYDVPAKLGWERYGWDPAAPLNPMPHPFP